MVTGVAMLLGLCAVSIQLLMRLNADGQARYARPSALERLARQLRDDAHASETAQIAGRRQSSRTAARPAAVFEPDHTSSTSPATDRRGPDRVRAGKMVRHEAIALARGASRAVRAPRRRLAPAGGRLVLDRPAARARPNRPGRSRWWLTGQGSRGVHRGRKGTASRDDRRRAVRPSRGLTVVAVLVCLIIVTLISGAVLKVELAQRELARARSTGFRPSGSPSRGPSGRSPGSPSIATTPARPGHSPPPSLGHGEACTAGRAARQRPGHRRPGHDRRRARARQRQPNRRRDPRSRPTIPSMPRCRAQSKEIMI